MTALIGSDISSEILPPSPEQCTYFPKREVFASRLIHLPYANEGLNLVRGIVMGEIEESTILFTIMGNVFSSVNQYRSLFSHARYEMQQ